MIRMTDYFLSSCQNEIQTLIQKLTKNRNNNEFFVLKIFKSGYMLKWLIKLFLEPETLSALPNQLWFQNVVGIPPLSLNTWLCYISFHNLFFKKQHRMKNCQYAIVECPYSMFGCASNVSILFHFYKYPNICDAKFLLDSLRENKLAKKINQRNPLQMI